MRYQWNELNMTGALRMIFKVAIVLCIVQIVEADGAASEKNTVEAALNGLSVAIDKNTGSISRLEYGTLGCFLESPPDFGSLLDLAYPIAEFEPLRLASKYSSNAKVEVSNRALTVSWEKLGASRPFDLPGSVSATVWMKAAEDHRSIIFSCAVENLSTLPVKQVLFPDLAGLIPFAGEDGTEFRAAGLRMKPFLELRTSDLDRFYATNASIKVLESGDLNDTKMIVRWMDLGSLQGGFSLFARRWGWEPHTRVLLHLSDRTKRLRLMNEHSVAIEPGERWFSGEFWLTPHEHGWAKGIEVYREWAASQMKREYPLPKHVREGLGFRSIWMCQNQPGDPQDAIWKFQDLPQLALEAKAHGLTEMVMWIWHKPFVLPFPPPYAHLGTERDLIEAVKQCREIGVNIAPFVSVLQAEKETAERYGLTVKEGSGNWTYHTEFFPRFNPSYASRFKCVQSDTTNSRWQDDVFASCERMIRLGIPSLCWDQYWSVPEEPNLNTLTSRIRRLAKQIDSESTFSGEELKNFEINSNYLDYTWNWGQHEDIQPLVSVFPAPRINVNINTSPKTVKLCFADNLYINVWPMRPDSPNGSDWIENHKELSSTLKECAELRARFLPYFTDGTFISNCVLQEPCLNAHVSAYVLPGKALVVVMNMSDSASVSLSADLQPWLPSSTGRYKLKTYSADGRPISTKTLKSGVWKVKKHPMQYLEIALFEFTPDA